MRTTGRLVDNGRLRTLRGLSDRPGIPEPRPVHWARLRRQAFAIAPTAAVRPAARPGTS